MSALVLAETRADVEDGAVETPVVDEGVSNALPVDGAAPEPAPEDEPALFDDTDADVPPAEA